MPIKLKRAYEHPSADDGERYLVERLWPRGVSKDALALSGWLKDLAPSSELRRWYAHKPERWPEFTRRYRAELKLPQMQPLLAGLLKKVKSGDVTLVFAARDAEASSAAVLRSVLEEMR